MNRNTKLKPLAPRPAADQGCHQMMSYSCSSMGAEGRTGSINRNAFVGANLGVHASPLEAVTSMDPKDYVWGGGYNDSFYGCQPSAFAGAQACYYTQEYSGQHGHYGYAQQYQPTTGTPAAVQPFASSVSSVPYSGSAVDSSRGDMLGHSGSLSDTQTSQTEDVGHTAPLDSKVDDLLDLDDDVLKKLLSPASIVEAAEPVDEDSGSCKKMRHLDSTASGDSHMSGSEEFILPDFGEGFGNSDGMLLDMRVGASPLSNGPEMDEANPYLSPLLDPPTLVGGNPTASKVSGDLHTGTDRFKGQNSKERLKQMLSEVSMAEAVQCIAQFLSNDKRIDKEKRQAAVSAVQAICPTKSLVVTLRQPVPTLKPQLKRKRSSSKALEAARNS